jgi:WD40 repeat protein
MKSQNRKSVFLTFALAVLVLSLSAVQDSKAASFVSTGPMNRGRSSHSATLLPNGKVLVAGGYSSTVTELFDPATGTWTMTGRLGASRSLHTATLLPNGKVLVAGGGDPATAGAELYDPASGTWTFTGSMRTRREGHTATLLPNGKVLVAGGFLESEGLCCFSQSSTELYDPATGNWTLTASMSTTRDNHTATLLPNGKLAVAGGHSRQGGSAPSSAELYDPITGTWNVTGSLSNSYSEHTATLLPNGKILIAGGCPCRDVASNNVRSVEVYDPATGIWTPTGLMLTGRGLHTATLLPNGQVLVAGGYSAPPQSSAELYNPGAGIWAQTGTMNISRLAHTATLLTNGNVLVAGGYGSSSAEIYQADRDDAAPSITLLHRANQIMSFYWSGVGTLEETDDLTTPDWQPVPIQSNPQILMMIGAMKFYRVQAD